MFNFKKSLTLFVLPLLPVMGFAQPYCSTDIAHSSQFFKDNGDGTVTDNKTGLMWKKCSEGQSGADCSGGTEEVYTWEEALEQAKTINNNGGFAGYSNWRVPNLKELESIIEKECFAPAINLTIFPNTPSNLFWSSSPHAYNSGLAWHINFSSGSDNLGNAVKFSGGRVRLVRENQVINKAVVPEKKAVSENEIATATEKDIPFKMEFSCTKESELRLPSTVSGLSIPPVPNLITHDHYDVDYKNGNLFILEKNFGKKVGELEYKQSQGIFDNPNYEIEAKSITKIDIDKEESGFNPYNRRLFVLVNCYRFNIYGAFKDNPEFSPGTRVVSSDNIDDLNKLKNKLLSINKNIQVNGQ